ncbi:MAG: SPFH/Band 7/PHB domain protein [Candidatus Moranbacteria bacterium]|nr:SPFH/Band 7/PHB domain protein [Candidatus Moranbacteria bacterium]MDD3964520.1 SPFH/Band 7/PHB domain protein [Candidatus Moranbacteria bacterium]
MDSVNILGIFVGIAIVYGFLVIRYVNKPFHWVVEINLLKKMSCSVWEPGLQVLWFPIPPFMFVKNKIDMSQKPVTIHMGMKEGVGRHDPIDFKDAKAGVLVQVIYEVQDPIKATYDVQESNLDIVSHDDTGKEIHLHFHGYERATLNRIEATLRSFFGSYTFDEANEDSNKSAVEKGVTEKVQKEILDNWGVKVILIDIIDFVLDEKTAEIRQGRLAAKVKAETLALEAEGEKNATITIAEGKKQATITIAQGEREAAQLAGQGEQERLKAVADSGLGSAHAAAYIIARGANEAIAKGNATIIATSEGGNMNFAATLAGIAKGMSGEGEKKSQPTDPKTTSGTSSTSTPSLTPRKRGGNNT